MQADVVSLVIEPTDDGSVTLYRSDIDEHYHSVKGALAEGRHIYVGLGWRLMAGNMRKLPLGRPVRVFEVGFGTGLNAALTALEACQLKVPTEYLSIDLRPLPADMVNRLLPFQPEEISDYFSGVNAAPWERTVQMSQYFSLHKIKTNLLTMELPGDLDVVYFDAFAPEKQPEMWTRSVFERLYSRMSPGGILVTYCAKGAIRRLLQETGFRVERLPGPPGGKREVLRATRV